MTIEQIRDQNDLVELVSRYVPLKKRGAEFWACCPLHAEKTPSFHVSPAKQLWKCFGCGEGGDVFSFVMQMDGCTFREAVQKLANGMGTAPTSHRLRSRMPSFASEPRLTEKDCLSFLEACRRATTQEMVSRHAAQLGVSVLSLNLLGAAWSENHRAWAWPMFDGRARICGIRLRTEDGSRKFAVRGSRQGVFCPDDDSQSALGTICEGVTDTLAAVTMGLTAIGRPTCNSAAEIVVAVVRQRGWRRAIIIADNDENGAGLAGAEKLQAELLIPSMIFLPATKDLRSMLLAVGDPSIARQLIQNAVADMVWTPGVAAEYA